MGKSEKPTLASRRQRFLRAFQERFFLRFHMTLIMLAVMLSGVLASKILWRFGVSSMAVRYPMAVVCSYGVFFALISIWLLYIQASHEGDHDTAVDIGDAVGEGARAVVQLSGSPAEGLGSAKLSDGGGGGGSSWSLGDGDGEGLIVLALLVVLLIVVFCSGLYVVWEAPNILAEAAFQAVLATSLRRRARLVDQPGWTGSLLQATWWPFAIVLVAAGLFGVAATHYCPTMTRLPEVLHQCLPEHGIHVG
ncbi:MAG TPA: hypothetical protein PKI03_35445 [Pseudomonadota bacterium]|nr:hypothetical protein [Pseudomonadota bacterium]